MAEISSEKPVEIPVVDYSLDYPVICSPDNVLRAFSEEKDEKEVYGWENKMQVPQWCNAFTRGCHVGSGVVVAGSSEGHDHKKVYLLDVHNGRTKKLPNFIDPLACAGMAWDYADDSLVLVGGVQYKEEGARATRQMFRLTNVVGEDGSEWVPLQCRLPSTEDLNNTFELLMSDSHLYLLGCDATGKGVQRIPKNKLDKLKPDSKSDASDWEKLDDLNSEIKSNYGKGGAVFIQGKVIVFTLQHIMKLDLESKPPKWTNIEETHFENCIPRKLNDNIILVLVNRKNDNDIQENVMEMYDLEKGTWKPWEPSVSDGDDHKKVIQEARWDNPWKFFVVHTDGVGPDNLSDIRQRLLNVAPAATDADEINVELDQ